MKGDWKAAQKIMDEHPGCLVAKINGRGETALHIAAAAGRTKFVERLVSKMESQDLLMKNASNNTALCLAAVSNSIPTARVLVENLPQLLTIKGCNEWTPVCMAAMLGHGNMVKYFLTCPQSTGLQQLGDHQSCVDFLINTISANLYEQALDFLDKFPNSIAAATQRGRMYKLNALEILATKTQYCRTHISFWRRYILPLVIRQEEEEEYDDALTPALKLVKRLWDSVLENNEMTDAKISELIVPTLFKAAEAGNAGFIRIITHSYPDVIQQYGPNNKTIFHIAIEHRQEEVFRLILDIGAFKETFTMYIDQHGIGMLHLAAKLPVSRDTLSLVPGPVLQMQEEVRWFKAVTDIMEPHYSQYESVRHIFRAEHEELREKGEKWMKKAAVSYGLVATLIASVMFGSSTTFPQNWTDDVHRGERMIFAISDAVSLVSSTSSILIFVSILTSRCAHEHFFKMLPFKLAAGLLFLFLAFVAMMVAFVVTLRINVKYHALWIASAAIAGALMSIITYLHKSTYTIVKRLIIGTKLKKRLSKPLL